MMLGRRPRASDDHAPSAQPTSEARHHRVGERVRDGQTLAQEELRQEDHTTTYSSGAPRRLRVCPWTALRPAPKAPDADAAIEEAINASRRLKLESTSQH